MRSKSRAFCSVARLSLDSSFIKLLRIITTMANFTRINFGNAPGGAEDPTFENIDKAEQWQDFFVLGDWVKQVPDILKILWKSATPAELENARADLFKPFFTLKEEFVQNNNRDNEILLVNLLNQIIEYCWPVLKNREAPQKGLLFQALMSTAQAINIKNDPDKFFQWHPSAEKNLYKGTEFIDQLIASAQDDQLMLRCCGLMPVRYNVVSSKDKFILPPLAEAMQRTTDDITRACFALSIAEMIQRAVFVETEYKQEMRDLLANYLSLPEPLSATRLVSAIYLSRHLTNQASVDITNILADYMLIAAEMEDYCGDSVLASFVPFAQNIHNSVSSLPPACDQFITRALTNLETLDKAKAKSLLTGACIVVEYALIEDLVEGVKIIDLSALSVTVLKHLAQLENVWHLPAFIELLKAKGLPTSKEDLQKFIEDTSDDGVKRFPAFEGIDDIPWHDLHHAYGAATDVPSLLRMLVSFNSEARAGAQEALYSNIYHQGSVYPATPYAVPYLLEMLECSMVQGKADILNLCRDLLVSWARGAFLKQHGFDVNIDYPDKNDEEHVIKHKIEENIVAGLSIILNQLTNGSQGVIRACAANLLAMLPRVAAQTVPLMKQQLEVESDVPAEAAMMLSLGIILPKVESRETCLEYFTDKWNALKDTNKAAVKFCIAACIARQYFDQQQRPPAFVVEQLSLAIDDNSNLAYYAFDEAPSLAVSMLPLLKLEEALPLIVKRFVKKLFNNMPTIRAMVGMAFRAEIENNKPINPSSVTAQQIEVLQAMNDKPDLWRYGNAINYFRQVGLPSYKNDMEEFLEKAKAAMDVKNE